MRARLSNRTLSSLPKDVALPRYDRAGIRPGIVHLGVGAFHRAHQAVYVDDCLAAGQPEWGIVGASLRSAETRDALAPQDGLYTLCVRSSGEERPRVVGSLLSILTAPENPSALLEVLCDPRIRIVTLTITEKAYLRKAGGDLDDAHEDIAWDLANPGRPRTAHGFLVEAIARRRAAGAPVMTLLCCDNLPANGETLQRLLLQFAELRDPELARFIADSVAFPSTMVDRIVPATTDADRQHVAARLGLEDAWPIITEPFTQWVVEDRFTAGRPAWEQFGVTMVQDVRPFENMKLRLLNGAHSGIAYLGLLSGFATVSDAFGDPRIRSFVDGLWSEAASTLPTGAGLDAAAYTAQLADRFSNTALVHRTAQIAMDGSQKLPQRIVASALERLETGRSAEHLALVVAAWIAACAARGGMLAAGLFPDPLDARLAPLLAASQPAPETVRAVFSIAGFASNHPAREALMRHVAHHLDTINEKGVDAALERLKEQRT